MKKIVYLITLLCAVLLQETKAQPNGALYFEDAPNNMMRFYFDQNYFLVDKNCEFKYVERVSSFDKKTNKFEGVFKDFDPNGRLILTGHYQEGKKQGEFKAFHPNGALKWETNFINDAPSGSWKYYYPDGKPMLFVTITLNNFYINQYWNREGTQLVKDGEGKYDIDLPIVGFTDHGYTRFNRQGKVKNGQPDGIWYISFVDERKRRDTHLLFIEQYEDGRLNGKNFEEGFEHLLIAEEDFVFTPNDYFPRAEFMLSKRCSFDEFTGFNIFIANKFTKYLSEVGYSNNQDVQKEITYVVNVSKNGVPSSAKLENIASFSKEERFHFNQMINQIGYYLPSYNQSLPIADILTIKFVIQSQAGTIHISPVQIQREKGV
ncbi:toxin-antitoxin system YwqK family antitoxin [Sphingobacterium yanglingense]|uniref:MORN repeat protein n=1 Tax=Sphingobacterium yanglingense TaxID=1437280 RepID=A0A4R6W441_9SPHI|nr:hypothetical protein [Sphingobacterium yanglingense]TDQ73338.1 hypothetical protein CLV99_4390 [Sphingobacterium yanglingense]